MPPKKACTQKGRERDPDLSQLLRLVLEKLGSEESSVAIEAPKKDGGREKGSRPKRSHVAPNAAFPPVKRRRNAKAQVPATIILTPPAAAPATIVLSPPAATSLSEQLSVPVATAPLTGPLPTPQVLNSGSTAPSGVGIEGVLADICNSLAALAPTAQPGPSPTPHQGVVSPATSGPPPVGCHDSRAHDQEPSRLALMEVSKLLAGINAPTTTAPPPTAPWGADVSWQNTVADLKCQVDSLVAAHSSNSLQASINSQCVAPAPSICLPSPPLVQDVQPNSSKLPSPDIPAKEGTTDSLLSRPGKLAAHVSAETREKIWKGDFVDIFSLIRAKRREIEGKEKEHKSSSYSERKPRIEENITNWLLGFNVFMSILLEKKTELGTSLIYYANKILKAQHTYGGSAWLEYDRDFRWAKVEDPSIGWDQTEVNVWLECVNNKVPGRQPFRPQLSGEKKGSCWAFNRRSCSHPAGTCKFKHNCSFCGHPSHPESKCIKKSKERGRDPSKPSN
ncbi:hypothetical protein NDU88_003490 [Pleurodeles waltl]|uniref:C3H1-type domain-containing protein n=1 Tax=Pleurodeles waltl TaxID=8319 RepID=A0AAV7NKS8_PLEWA|nr:hypothetical protein NDU88_003490 [Pleurodeles waltl]